MHTATRSNWSALTALAFVCTGALAPPVVAGAGQAPAAPQSGAQQSGMQQPGAGQPPGPPQPGAAPPTDPIVSPGEIQRMFEAVALVRAQEALKLTDEKYLPFIAKYKALQDVRRKSQQEHNRILNDLRKLSNDPAGDEAQMRDRLKMLEDLRVRSTTDIRKAQDGVDAVLDVRQQAKFRLFEEAMEVQKVELITKARQAARQQRKNP